MMKSERIVEQAINKIRLWLIVRTLLKSTSLQNAIVKFVGINGIDYHSANRVRNLHTTAGEWLEFISIHLIQYLFAIL